MQTINVVFSRYSSPIRYISTMKIYVFNVAIGGRVSVGDIIKVPEYNDFIHVVSVGNSSSETNFNFYDRITGELSEKLTNKNHLPIKELNIPSNIINPKVGYVINHETIIDRQ